jgi:hypothetical protein
MLSSYAVCVAVRRHWNVGSAHLLHWLAKTTPESVGWLAVFYFLHFIVGMPIPQISGGEVTAGEEKIACRQ